MHEGCVPSPNQIVRGLDQPIYSVAGGVGERRELPFLYLMAESLISLATSRYLSALRSSPSPPLSLKNLAASKMPLIRCFKTISFIFKGQEKEIKMP